MPDFDAALYARTVDLFTSAKEARAALPSLIAQIRDSVDLMGAVKLDGMPRGTSSGNPQEEKIVAHIGLMDLMERRKARYEQLLCDCERVIQNMEDFGDGNGTDAAYLRYCYLQGMTQEKACQKSGHARSYYREKNSIALIHASYAVKRLGL